MKKNKDQHIPELSEIMNETSKLLKEKGFPEPIQGDQDEMWTDIRNTMVVEWISISRHEKGVRSAMDILKSKYTIAIKK